MWHTELKPEIADKGKGGGGEESAGIFDGSVAGAAHLTHDTLLDEIQPEKKNPKKAHNHTDSMLTRGTVCLQSAINRGTNKKLQGERTE